MKTKRILAMLALSATLIFAAISAEAKGPGAIEGTVYTLATGDPVQGAEITLAETGASTITDSLGRFRFDSVRPGKYTILVDHVDFVAVTQATGITVEVMTRQTATIAIPLSTGLIYDEVNEPSTVAPADRTRQDASSADKKATGSGILDKFGITRWETSKQETTMPPHRPDVQHEYDADYYSLPPFDMFFQDYGTNGFVNTRHDRISTFALDVDDASYTLIRRYLQEGNLPPREAVRLEEFINHYDCGYKPPSHEEFRIFTELAPSPFRNDIMLMKVGIKGREIAPQQRKPLNLTFVIDVSGSMGYDNRMHLVQRSLGMLVSQLNGNDRVGIVAYGSRAFTVLEPTSARHRKRINSAIRTLHPGGSTYAEAGLRLGYQMANRQYVPGHTNRIILCSDGVANVGRTSADGIMNDIKRFARRGIVLSTFGFGMGNYNDVLLEQLAVKGNGRYAYVNNWAEAQKQFVNDFVSNMQVLARDAKVQVEFNPKMVQAYRLLGYENRAIADHRFRDNRQDGGEVGMGHQVTALYEVKLKNRGQRRDVATVFVRYKDAEARNVREVSRSVAMGDGWRKFDRARPEFKLAVAAVKFADVLKQAEYAEADYHRLLEIARPLVHELPGEQTRELVQLIERAWNLSSHFSGWDEDWHPHYNDDRNYRR
jgi:Ca-activated chloride channel family protein